jgi:hypothetical protein
MHIIVGDTFLRLKISHLPSSTRFEWLFSDQSCYGGRSGRVFGTLRYPHLILPYLAYYGHLASHYGGPWCSPIPLWCTEKHLQVPNPPIYVKLVGLPVLSVLTMGSLHTKPPPYDFLNWYGACLQAPRSPKMK